MKSLQCLAMFSSLQEKIVLLVTGYWLLVTLAGCATIIEGAKGIAGISTKILEDNRKDAIAKTFNYDYFTCYTNTLDILKHANSYIYTQSIKKHMIAIYVSEQDTAPIGLFFKEIDKNTTGIEISSPSKYAKELIAKRVFSALEKSFNPKEGEENASAK